MTKKERAELRQRAWRNYGKNHELRHAIKQTNRLRKPVKSL